MRSRTVSLPFAWWRSTFSAPPIRAAKARRRASSSSSGCHGPRPSESSVASRDWSSVTAPDATAVPAPSGLAPTSRLA